MIRPDRPGLTLVELSVVLLLLAFIAGLALPAYDGAMLRARAAAVVGELHAVRVAAMAYNAETGTWPADRHPGQLPPELERYLPDDFSFERGGYRLDWENWELANGTPKHPETGVLIGVSLTTQNAALGQALQDVLGRNTAHYTLGDNYTFVIASM